MTVRDWSRPRSIRACATEEAARAASAYESVRHRAVRAALRQEDPLRGRCRPVEQEATEIGRMLPERLRRAQDRRPVCAPLDGHAPAARNLGRPCRPCGTCPDHAISDARPAFQLRPGEVKLIAITEPAQVAGWEKTGSPISAGLV